VVVVVMTKTPTQLFQQDFLAIAGGYHHVRFIRPGLPDDVSLGLTSMCQVRMCTQTAKYDKSDGNEWNGID
jgi:hypothetical protein